MEKMTLLQTNTAEHLISSPCDDGGFCITEDCVSMASRISTLMNPKADPCSDFYEYSCGGYATAMPLPLGQNGYSLVKEAELETLRNIRNVMEYPSGNDDSATLLKMKQIFKSCIDNGKRNETDIESLNSWLSDLEIWLEDAQNEIAAPLEEVGSWRTIVSKLEQYQIHTVIQPTFKGSTSSPIEKIEVECPLSLFQVDVYLVPSLENIHKLRMYREVMNETLSFLSMESTSRKQFIEEVIKMETDIARAVQNSETSENSGLSEEHVEHLKGIWRPLIGEAVQDSEIVDVCKHNLPGIISALNQAPPRVSARYVLWKMLFQIMPYLGKEFQKLKLHYTGFVPLWQESLDKNWKSCSEFLRQELGLAAYKVLVDHGYIKPQHQEKLKNIFTHLKTEFKSIVQTIPRLDRLTKKLMQNKLKTMKLHFGYPEILHQPLVPDRVYRDLESIDNYFVNVMNLKKFKTRYLFNRLWYGNSEDSVSEISLMENPLGIISEYDYIRNTIKIGSHLIQFPIYFFSGDLPMYLEYGEISSLARVMTHAFDATGCYYDQSGRKWDKSLWPYPLREKYDFYVDCLLNQTSSSEYYFAEINNVEWMNTIMADIGSFLVGYEGLSKYLQNETEENDLPGISLNRRQLYYVQVAQKYCEVKVPETSLPFTEESLLPARSRVNIAVSNMIDFGNVFNCPLHSPLNPELKCNTAS